MKYVLLTHFQKLKFMAFEPQTSKVEVATCATSSFMQACKHFESFTCVDDIHRVGGVKIFKCKSTLLHVKILCDVACVKCCAQTTP